MTVSDRYPTILQVIPELDTGGAELSTIEVAEAIVKAGGRALVATAGGEMEGRLRAVGGEPVILPMASKNPLTMWANAKQLEKLIKNEGVGLVHARSRAPAWSAYPAANRTRVPFVTTYHGAYGENGPVKRAYNSVMARGVVVIANSAYTARLIQQRYETPPDKIVVINRGVDLDAFERASIGEQRISDLRTQWDVPAGARIILHAARLTRWKGQPSVIEAAGLLAKRGRLEDVVFVFAGSDQGRTDYSVELKDRVAALGIKAHVRFAGHVGDMAAAFAAADIALVASTEPEAFGRTAAEAQAVGTPVIATQIGAPQETVLSPPSVEKSAATGRLVPPGNAEALAAAIDDLLTLPPSERDALSQRAARHAHANYSMRQLQRATLGVYDRLLGTELAARFDEAGVGNGNAPQ